VTKRIVDCEVSVNKNKNHAINAKYETKKAANRKRKRLAVKVLGQGLNPTGSLPFVG